jgi:hypothetical protein
MKSSYYAVLSMLLFLANLSVNAQTTLAAGDIVIIGWNATDNNINTPGNAYTDDDIDFLLLRDIDANTVIFFTDFGWTGTGFQQNELSTSGCTTGTGAISDGCIRWTTASAMVKGTQVRVGVKNGLIASAGTVTSINGSVGGTQMSLSTSTDQIFAFQGSLASPTLIAAVQYGGSTWSGSGITTCSPTSSSISNNPGVNVGGFAFLFTPTTDNNQYTGSKSGSITTIRTNVLNAANWAGNSTALTFPQVSGFSVLPVHVTSFTGKNTTSGHSLEWNVSNEENFSRYEVETSTDGHQYTVAGVVNAENKTGYTFTGKSLPSDHQFYRLKLIDHDGKAEYSKIIMFQNTSADKIVVFPNPVKDVVTISSIENIIEMKLFDMSGRLCRKQKENNNNTTALDMRSFKPGAYILTITTGAGIQAQKIFKWE